jgi:putative FmdB family regulatory protein
MPLYEYECDACGARFELIQRFSDRPPETCSRCGSGPVRKLLSSPAIQFKGSGWYITDYARKDQKAGAAKGDQKEGGGSGETATAKDQGTRDQGTKDQGTKDQGKEKSGKEKSTASDKAPAAPKTAPASE